MDFPPSKATARVTPVRISKRDKTKTFQRERFTLEMTFDQANRRWRTNFQCQEIS